MKTKKTNDNKNKVIEIIKSIFNILILIVDKTLVPITKWLIKDTVKSANPFSTSKKR